MKAVNFMDERLPNAFWSRVQPCPMSGCWLWAAYCDKRGYGRYTIAKVGRLAHRVAYKALVGEPPDGTELDHLCRNTLCCNPAHLEPVTHAENVRRGSRAMKTHCPKGHEYNARNTWMNNGKRTCGVCQNKARRIKAARLMAERVERHKAGLRTEHAEHGQPVELREGNVRVAETDST